MTVTPPGAPPTQGTDPAAAQPPAQGQAQAGQASTGQGGFNWGFFPDVPENVRPQLEPHLKNVQAHVTRLEQQISPYKPFIESGLDPGRLQGLANFAQQFEANPLETFLGMAANLQEAGIIDEGLDLQELQAVSQGIDTGGEGQQVPQGVGEGEMPPWAQQLMQKMEAMENESQQEKSQRQQRLQDQFLQRQITRAREELKSAGVQMPEDDQVAEKMIVGQIIAHGGQVEPAIQAMTGFRESNLQAAMGQRQGQQGKEPNMPKGAPPAPPRSPEGPPPRDGFAAVRAGAQQHLEQAAASAAEEG